jgi:hypothetical protein
MYLSSTNGRALAIAAGLAFTAGGLTILLGDALMRPFEWSSYQWLTILTVFGTIAAGHLMAEAGRARHLFSTVGFLALFLAGTGLVVYSSVGRQVEAAAVSMFSAEDMNNRLASKHVELAGARDRLAYAESQFESEQTGQRCADRCKRWEKTASDRRIVVRAIEAEIASLGPQKPVNAQAEAMADIAALFGLNKQKTVAALILLAPFLTTLFFEIGSIVSLGYAFAPRVSATVSPETVTGGGGKALRLVAKPDPDTVVVKRILHSNPGISNDELAALMRVTKGESSKRVAKAIAGGTVSKVRAGRQVALYAH